MQFSPDCLVIVEGEFKALSLAEAGIPAVGIGGISSAMAEGKLIPDLARVVSKYHPKIIYFLGDTDTALLFEFSREAVKLANALPEGCKVRVPRIPLSMPKGIDDVREELGEEFVDFWQKIIANAIEVTRKLSADALAVSIVTRELPIIATLPDRDTLIPRLAELASFLDPLHREMLAKTVKETLGQPITGFRETAKQITANRKKKAAERFREQDPRDKEDVARIVNDSRPKIELPGSRNRLLSEFGADVGPIWPSMASSLRTVLWYALVFKVQP
jgi:DNA primase